MAKNTTTTKNETATLPLYRNTIAVKGRKGGKTITGTGTIADLAKKMGFKQIPPAHSFVKGLEACGLAKVRKDVTAPKPERGRTSAVYEFSVNVEAPEAPVEA